MTSLLKTIFHNTIAESVLKEIENRSSNYYYFLGRTLPWSNEVTPETPLDGLKYEYQTRNQIISAKLIKSTDAALIISRYNWQSGIVYDQYDDRYDTSITGVNLTSGGSNYLDTPNVYIGDQGSVTWTASTSYVAGQLIKADTRYYVTMNAGISSVEMPAHTTGTMNNGTASFKAVAINTGGGTGATATATIFGDAVIDINLTNAGSGYTSVPTVTIAGISGSNAIATAGLSVAPNTGSQKLENTKFYVVTDEFNVYKCINNNYGTTSTIKPVGTSHLPLVLEDGYIWKFMYNVPVALRNKFLTANYMPVTNALRAAYYSNGIIQNVKIDSPGVDYTTATIIVSGDGYLAENPYNIVNVTVNSGGTGYVSPTLVVTPPVTGATGWLSGASVYIGQKLYNGTHYYEVQTIGITGVVAPTHTTGTVSNGTTSLKYIGTICTGTVTLTGAVVTGVVITSPGYGYNGAPTATIEDSSGIGATVTINVEKTEAILTPVIEDGQIVEVTVEDGGIGYTYVTLTVNGDGTEAYLTADLSAGDLDTYQSNNELLTVDGTINNIQVSSNGYGYNAASVVITGDGTGATAQAVIVNNRVTKINMLSYGQGYRWAIATITGDGYGAKARVILSPYGGHGKNAINELYAKNLMLYSNLSLDPIQGFDINNDYRQVGILKEPKLYNGQGLLTSNISTPCWVVAGTFNYVNFPEDSIITDGDSNRYRIISSKENSLLVQSLDNAEPVIGSTMNNATNTFLVSQIKAPTLDKYSGDLLFIDNKQAFASSTEQLITLRTAIKF